MTEELDTGALIVPGGFFIVRAGHPPRTPFRSTGSTESGYRHSHTYVAGESTTRADLISLIDNATHRILLSSFLIGDALLRSALERAVKRLKGGVHVITNIEARQAGPELAAAPPPMTPPPEEVRERRSFEVLSGLGVAIRGYPGCHAKFAIIDDRVTFVHSANFMTRAFDVTGENGVVVFDPDEVERACHFFARLWNGARWEMDTTGTCAVLPRAPEPLERPPSSPIWKQRSKHGLIWTFHEEHQILSTIIDLISTAEHALTLSTFNVSEMTRRPDLLHDHLRAAAARGVSIRMLLRARSVPEAGAEAAALQELGVRLHPCSLNHAKGVIADRKRGALFSANFDARFGLDSDIELGVRLDGTNALTEALRFFEHSIVEHDRTFVRDPDVYTLARGWRTPPWPIADHVNVTAGPEDWRPLRDLRTGPVVFERNGDELNLYAENRSWRLCPDQTQVSYFLEARPHQEIDAMTRLRQPILRPAATPPGLCTAILRLTPRR